MSGVSSVHRGGERVLHPGPALSSTQASGREACRGRKPSGKVREQVNFEHRRMSKKCDHGWEFNSLHPSMLTAGKYVGEIENEAR